MDLVSFKTPTAIIAVILALAICLMLKYLMTDPHDPREPCLIHPRIPYVGHLLELLRIGSFYYTVLSTKFPLPIYTLRVPRTRIYIVNSPKLVTAVERNSKTLSFGPYAIEFLKRTLHPSPEALEILASKMYEENEALSCHAETLKVMRLSSAPGDSLNHMSQVMLESVCSLLDSPCSFSNLETVDMFSWVQRCITRASTDTIYGPSKNPFKDPEVEKGFWAIHKDFAFLGLNVLPNIIARKAYRGREKFFQGFQKYYAEGSHKSGSHMIQARYEVNCKHNVPLADIERFDLSLSIGLLVNTAPATSWVLYYTYSHPSLLMDLRETLSSFVHVSSDRPNAKSPVFHVDIAGIIAGCPLLMSIVLETLRVQSTNASGRMVLKDTLLDNHYLLKQGSMLLMPSAELHANSSAWGSFAKDFDPQRFMKRGGGQESKRPSGAYRVFGGGNTLCPGRYFSVIEIMAFTAIMVLKYDLDPVNQNKWVMPNCHPHILTSILTPIEDVKVAIRKRRGYERQTWKFSLNDSFVGCPDPSL